MLGRTGYRLSWISAERNHSIPLGGRRERGPSITPLLCREGCFEIIRCVSTEYVHTFAEMRILVLSQKDALHGYLRARVDRRSREACVFADWIPRTFALNESVLGS